MTPPLLECSALAACCEQPAAAIDRVLRHALPCCDVLFLPLQMTSSVDMGGKVDSLLFSGGFLFVGMQNETGVDNSTGKPVIEGVIRIWNMATGQNHNLSGHKVSQIKAVLTIEKSISVHKGGLLKLLTLTLGMFGHPLRVKSCACTLPEACSSVPARIKAFECGATVQKAAPSLPR